MSPLASIRTIWHTGIRVPLMQACPWQTLGSITIRSSISEESTLCRADGKFGNGAPLGLPPDLGTMRPAEQPAESGARESEPAVPAPAGQGAALRSRRPPTAPVEQQGNHKRLGKKGLAVDKSRLAPARISAYLHADGLHQQS